MQQAYLEKLNAYEMGNDLPLTVQLPVYAAETVDAVVAFAKALSMLPHASRSNGKLVRDNIRALNFNGVSGRVAFTTAGDRKNPRYTVLNMAAPNQWRNIGSIGLTKESAMLDNMKICWADGGCGADIPGDTTTIGWASWSLIALSVVIVGIFLCYILMLKRREKTLIGAAAVAAVDGELEELEKKIEEAKAKQAELLKQRIANAAMPGTWDCSQTETLVEVLPTDAQYWDVHETFTKTMDTEAWLSKVWRIQNNSLFNFYSFHKNRLAGRCDVGHAERTVWHGTSQLDPSVVYSDAESGFMMQYSRGGFWGRGIYFADRAGYSTDYSFRPSQGPPQGFDDGRRSRGEKDEREMFLAKLLVGDQTFIPGPTPQTKALVVPPNKPNSGEKFNTVAGHTNRSDVWIVYENGRAYPEYLIRFYEGERDQLRTPFLSRQQAGASTAIKKTWSADVEAGSSSMADQIEPITTLQLPKTEEVAEEAVAPRNTQTLPRQVVRIGPKSPDRIRPKSPGEAVPLTSQCQQAQLEAGSSPPASSSTFTPLTVLPNTKKTCPQCPSWQSGGSNSGDRDNDTRQCQWWNTGGARVSLCFHSQGRNDACGGEKVEDDRVRERGGVREEELMQMLESRGQGHEEGGSGGEEELMDLVERRGQGHEEGGSGGEEELRNMMQRRGQEHEGGGPSSME